MTTVEISLFGAEQAPAPAVRKSTKRTRARKNALLGLTKSTGEQKVIKRDAMLELLRERARAIYAETGQPVSANDIRYLVTESGFDLRILGSVFKGKGWQWAGLTTSTTDTAPIAGRARSGIGQYTPVGERAAR